MKQKYNIIRSRCIPMDRENIDTDQIIPARFLKSVSRDEKFFGEHLFHDQRYHADGSPDKCFVLNDPRYSGTILAAGKNFGCGSSREHAAWAIAGYGFQAVISSSFADIHKQNELNNFIIPVTVSEDFLAELFRRIEHDPATEVEINLPEATVEICGTEYKESFPISGFKKYCFANGLDDIDFLLENRDKTEKWEKNTEYGK